MSAVLQPVAVAAAVALEVRALAHRYGTRSGLEPLSFAATAPGVTVVTGPNGSGKSTLLRIVAGLLRPTQGDVLLAIAGRLLVAPERRAAVGFASPELQFYDGFTAIENLRFAAEARGLATPAEAARAALVRAGLDARADDRVAALSSGLKQRLRLAFAVLAAPHVLLLDEPESHLDGAGRDVLGGLIREHARTGLVLLATNDEDGKNLGDQRVELRGGGLGRPA
jgi:heme exporter protein A